MAEDLDPLRQNIEINVTDKGADESTKDLAKLNTTITDTTESSKKLTTENKKQEEGFKSLKVQLKEAIVLQQKMSATYGNTSKEAIAATKAVAGIKDEIGFQKDLVESYNPDEKFRGLTQTAGLAALALGGVKDGLAAVGIESKALDTLIGSAQAILGVTSAVAGITDAYEVLTVAKKAKSAADVVEIGTTEALTVAEGQATAATWSWNAALLANPIVLITAGIIAAGAAIYAYVKIVSDAAEEEEKANVAAMQLSVALDNQAKAFDNNSKYTTANNNHKIALLKASGASEDQIYKETQALKAQEIQLAQNYRNELIRIEERAYQLNKANGTEATEAALKTAQENLKKANDLIISNFNEVDKIREDREVALVQAQTDARKKAAEEAKKAGEEEKARLKKLADEIMAQQMKSAQDALDIVNQLKENVETPAEREQREYDEAKAVLEANNLSTEELTVQHIDRMFEIYKKEREDKQALEDEFFAAEADRAIKRTEDELARDKAVADAKKANNEAIVANGENLVKNVAILAGKNKAIQKAAIIADGGISVGKAAVNTAEAVTKDLAKGFPLSAPLVALDVAVGATSIAAIVSNTNKALQAVGGGGGVSASGAGGVQPTRNVAQVGFQGSNENQISSAIAQQQKEQPPIQAFVVSQAMTDQQELDRKKELQNSF